LISDPAMILSVPLYDTVPINANTRCFYSLAASTPLFVTLVGDVYSLPTIRIQTTDVTKTGVYNIDVLFTDEYSGLQRTDTFQLTVSCVRSIVETAVLADVEYFITDTAITLQPTYGLNPAGCPDELTYQVT
jgi:hypothetical protein